MFFELKTGKERRDAREVITHCYKRLRKDNDILPEKQKIQFQKEIQKAQNAYTAEDPKLIKIVEGLVELYNKTFPEKSASGLRENGEVILVAFVLAMAFRTFFLQPFKIPTGSMQPTLNGVIIRPVEAEDKTWWYSILSRPLWGEQRVRLIAQSSGRFEQARGVHRGFLHQGSKTGFSSVFPVDATQFQIGDDIYEVPIDPEKFANEIEPALIQHGQYSSGELIMDKIVQTGDQLFVDRLTYNFRKPKRGDVFVFETQNIRYPTGRPLSGDFYIKRLAGVPGDTLQIKDRQLFVNNHLATEPGFQRVMSLSNGYNGYGSMQTPPWLGTPNSTVSIKQGEYFALGDNSFNSADSRYWGTVPYQSIVGRAFFVFWPFNRHFGRIN